jgi:murein DD-endopeptidase MepM/ murein hydrolase activator NlpD
MPEMAQQVLLLLLGCSVWAAVLWFASQPLLKKMPALQLWPGFYWLLLGLCFLPLLPISGIGQLWVIPSVLLQDTVYSLQTLTAQPLHPGLTEPATDWQPLWQLLLAAIASISLLQLWRVRQQWQRLQQLIALTEPLPAAAVLSPTQLAALPSQVTICQTPAAISPFIAGWHHLVLVVPAYIWQLSAQQRQLLLSHELIHLQRRDPQQLLLLRILVAVCWFMPVLRRIEQAFIQSVELSVDRAVLARQPELAALYGQTLLSSLALSQSGQVSKLTAGFIHDTSGEGGYRQRLQQLFQPAAPLALAQRWRLSIVFAGAALLLQLSGAALSYRPLPQYWLLPVANASISSFYAEQHPFRQNRPHQGVDFDAAAGISVSAAQKGKVLIADDSSLNSRYGKVVLLDHGHGYQTLYAHLHSIDVSPGQSVAAGEAIATVGATGRVTGPHLHFEILHHGQQQDPAAYLKLE